jgi:adenylate cyclase
MKLSTRLFIIVGTLFLLICLAVYLLPEYIVAAHVQEDREEFLEHIRERRREEQRGYFEWLGKEINAVKATIDADLVMVGDHTAIQEELQLNEPKMGPGIWKGLAAQLWETEQVDFIQIVRGGKTVGGDLRTGPSYPAMHTPINNHLSWVVVDEKGDKRAYLGLWLPTLDAVEGDVEEAEAHKSIPALFLLFDPETVLKGRFGELKSDEPILEYVITRLAEAEKLLKERKGLERYLQQLREERVPEPTPRSSLSAFFRNLDKKQTPERREFRRRFLDVLRTDDDLEMINAMAYVCTGGVICESPLDPEGPVGILHVVPEEGSGVAILAKDVFFDRPIYDVESFLKHHPDVVKEGISGDTFDLVTRRELGVLTLVNTLVWKGKGDTAFITMGISIEDLVETLSGISGEASFLIHKGELLAQAGVGVTSEQVKELIKTTPKLGENGMIKLGGVDFFYSTYVPEASWELKFVTLEPVGKALRPYELYKERSQKMMRQFTIQLLSVSVALFVLSLIALELIARQFTKPIRSLAGAARIIGEGNYQDVVLPRVSPTSKDEVSVLTRAFGTMVTGLFEREKMRSALDKVISKEVADEILKGNVELGGEVREVTVLFADIRSFTHMTENLPPEEVIGLLNQFMTRMAEVIEGHHGVIDKYIGDEIMALYGAPVSHKYSLLQGVLSAILMRTKLDEWNRERLEQGLFEVRMGIGVHTGPMVAGNMGAANRLNYTVLGANVNLASRLCDAAKPGEILITEVVAQNADVSESVELERGEAISMKGFTEPVQTYRVLGLKTGVSMEELSRRLQEFVKE